MRPTLLRGTRAASRTCRGSRLASDIVFSKGSASNWRRLLALSQGLTAALTVSRTVASEWRCVRHQRSTEAESMFVRPRHVLWRSSSDGTSQERYCSLPWRRPPSPAACSSFAREATGGRRPLEHGACIRIGTFMYGGRNFGFADAIVGARRMPSGSARLGRSIHRAVSTGHRLLLLLLAM